MYISNGELPVMFEILTLIGIYFIILIIIYGHVQQPKLCTDTPFAFGLYDRAPVTQPSVFIGSDGLTITLIGSSEPQQAVALTVVSAPSKYVIL